MTNNQLQIQSFCFGPFGTNTYVVSSFPSGEAGRGFILLIDPACSNEYEQQVLLDYINTLPVNQSVSPQDGLSAQRSVFCQRSGLTIIATHGHLDHLWGAAWASETWHTPVLMHPDDIPMAQAMQQQYDLFGVRQKPVPFQTASLTEYRPASPDRIQTGFQILHTPGHTPGCVCLYWPDEKVLFSGDTLFRMGYGRTDLPGGNMLQLIDSLEKLFTLPSDVRVYPGHGDFTTIGAEKR